MVEGIPIFAFSSLQEVVYFLNNPYDEKQTKLQQDHTSINQNMQTEASPNFADIKGQSAAKRALEIASAGGHNLI
jgi:magnesium chelatase family protein